MTSEQPIKNIREAVGVFRDAKSFEAAIDDLLTSGFDRTDLSLLAGERAIEEKLGHKFEKIRDLEDDSSAPRAAYVSTESRGDAEGGLVGGLLYVGATAAAGAIVASGGTPAAPVERDQAAHDLDHTRLGGSEQVEAPVRAEQVVRTGGRGRRSAGRRPPRRPRAPSGTLAPALAPPSLPSPAGVASPTTVCRRPSRAEARSRAPAAMARGTGDSGSCR